MTTLSTINNSGGQEVTVAVTIGNGTSLSAAVDLERYSLVGIQFPAAWTAAGISFQGSFDGTTFCDLWDETAEIAPTSPGASKYVVLDPAKYYGLRQLKVRSGTSASAVNQGADRVLQLVLRPA